MTLGSVVEVLTREWAGVIGWDGFSQRLVFLKTPPARGFDRDRLVGHSVRDQDMDWIRLWFEEVLQMDVAKQHVIDGVRLVGRMNTFHPVRDYLKTLSWDGTPRIDTWLESFCAVEPKDHEEMRLVREVGKRWLVACVARAMTPGCKVDSILVLEGRQGIGKSRALATLAGAGYFSDALIDFGTKDACQIIQGVWIHELAELDAIIRGGTSQSKAFITRSADRFRAPYARAPESIPRSVVFCGTVNHGYYLKDRTGNRRFWTVRCSGPLDVERLAAARDQIWAEACLRFEEGAVWHLSSELEALMGEQTAARVEVDPLEELVADWTAVHGDRPFGMNALLEGLGFRWQSRNAAVTRRVAPMLEGLGYERRRVGKRAERTYLYVSRDTVRAESGQDGAIPCPYPLNPLHRGG